MQATGLKAFRLSVQQARLWPLQQASDAYRVQCAVLLQGRLDVEVFLHAFQYLIDQHDILRTAFYRVPGMEVPLQIVADHAEVCCPVIDMGNLPAKSHIPQLDQCFTALQFEPWDLECAPLVYSGMLRFSQRAHVLLLCLPALCADSSTLAHIVSKLCRTYTAYLQGTNPAEEPLQYADLSAWQNKLRVAEDAVFERQYWSKIDLSQLASLPLPLEREGNAENHNSEVKHKFVPVLLNIPMEEVLLTEIQTLAQYYNTTTSTLLLACWQVMLWRLLDRQNLVVGVSGDGRNYEELASALGPLSRVVPLGISLADDLPFGQVVTIVSKSLQQAIKWQTYFTWETTGNDIMPHFFPISFEHDTWPAPFVAGALTASLYRRLSCTEPFALKLAAFQVDEHLQLELHYDAQRIAAEHATRLSAMLLTLLRHVVARPQTPLSMLSVLPHTEQEYLLHLFCAPKASLPLYGLHQLFEAQAERLPEQLAVISGSEQLTYRNLNSWANQLARVLRRRGVGPDVLVGLCVQRSVYMIVGLLAILKAGGAYVPLDPDSPVSRLGSQLQDMQTPWLLTQQELVPRLPTWRGTALCFEELMREMGEEPEGNLVANGDPNTIAYIIYTSGSTGTPKGVIVRQQSVCNYTLALSKLLAGKPGWQYATVSTLAADLGNTAIFCALASGGCLQVLDYETVTSTEAFAHWMAHHPIDVLKIVPSHLSALLSGEHARMILPRQALILGGEVLPRTLVERLRKLGGSCKLYNHYGPTETTIGVLVNELGALKATEEEDKEPEEESAVVALGRPITNTEAYVLDRWQQIVPVGMTGELYLGGEGLALGYLHQPEQTAERFVPHPFGEREGVRLYRTGDMVQYLSDGKIKFVGRRDSQVKLRGYRIELGEIETALRRHPRVRDSVVALKKDTAGEQRLIGYVVAQQQPVPGGSELRDFVREYLPEYMVPTSIMLLEALPLTMNGKVDRQQLPNPELLQGQLPHVVAAPRDPIEEVLLDIWKDLLKAPAIDIHENFFQLGGHSLLATQIISRIRAVLQVELSILSLFESPTIAELAQQVVYALRSRQSIQVPPLLQMPRSQDLPLSFAQQRLWFLDQLEPASTSYNKPMAIHLQGILHTRALERSLQEIVHRHESLRTTFQMRAGSPVQVIHPPDTYRLLVVDICGLMQEKRMDEAQRLIEQEGLRPFDLAEGPLLRVSLLWLGAQEHVLLLTMHHIISDAWSNDIFSRELTMLYQAFAAGLPSPLMPFSIQYADFALWQRQWLQGQLLEAQMAYWQQQLAGVSWLALPTDHPRPSVQTYRGAFRSVQLPSSLHERLTALCQQEGVTLFMVMLAAFQVLLARYTGQDDISVGSPIANRTHAELEGLIGFFVNTLVLRTDLSGDPSFQQLLHRVRETALGAYAHQDVPFELLVEVLQPQRNLSRSPLFQVMLSLQQASVSAKVEQERWEGLRLSRLNIEHVTAKFDLMMFVIVGESGLQNGVEYNTDLFDDDTIRRLLEHWQILLEGIVAAPQRHLSELPLLSKNECHRLLIEWNATRTDFPVHLCVYRLFEEQARQRPDALAVITAEEHLTYEKLNQQANQLAHYLHQFGVEPDVPVGICLDRSLKMVVGVLGILKAGGAYVPLDPAYPQQRLSLILRTAQLSIVLTQQHLVHLLTGQNIKVVDVERDWQAIAQQCTNNLEFTVDAKHLIYIIFTSGSTGMPKGIAMPHGALSNLIAWQQRHSQLGTGSRTLQFSSLSFDVACQELFATWSVGGILRLIESAHRADVQGLVSVLIEAAIERLFLPFVALQQLALAAEAQGSWPHHLLEVVTAGEQLQVTAALRTFFRQAKACTLYNQYGPAESHVVTAFELEADPAQWAVLPPIGRPIANTCIYLLTAHLQLVPVGALGEVYIGGSGLARGYVHRAELTAERFLPDPFSEQPGMRLYRTGDLGRYRADGTIEFVGRRDDQVKIRGYRVELAEIEVLLSQHPEVRECVVGVSENATADKHLVAYVVPNSNVSGKTASSNGLFEQANHPLQGRVAHELIPRLRGFLKEKLPAYMLPSTFLMLERLPLTPTGKIDRRALPTPQDIGKAAGGKFVAPRSAVEEMLATMWSDLLAMKQVGIHDNFFELGGHSLLATRLISRVRTVLQAEVSLRSLFEAPTIAELAQLVEHALHGKQTMEAPPLLPVSRSQDLPLSFAQQRLWFIDQLEPGNIAYIVFVAVRLQGPLHVAALEHSMQELVLRHEILRTVFRLKEDQPVQVIENAGRVHVPLAELSILSPEQRELEAQRLAQQEAHQPFDLAQGPLLRSVLLRLTEEEHVLLLSMHHIISDGWSMDILVRELSSLYNAFAVGEPSPLSELPIQYADYAHWQRHWLQPAVLEPQLTYWTRQLSGSLPLNIPTDYPRPELPSYRGANYAFLLPSDLSAAIVALSQQEGVTLFMTLLTAFQTLLYRYTGQTDIVVGTDIANRIHTETEALIGFFINLLVLRNDVSGTPTFRELLKRTREMVLGAYTYQNTPFEMVVERLLPDHALDRMPLVQVLFVLQNVPSTPTQLTKLVSSPFVSAGTTTAKFDLALFMLEGPSGLRGIVKYSTDLFEELTIATIISHFEVLLRNSIFQPDTPIDVLDYYTDAEKTRRAEQSKQSLRKLSMAKGREIQLSGM